MKTLLAALLLTCAAVQAQQTYQDRAAWEVAASGGVHTIYDFVGLPDGEPLGTYQGLTFEANDKAETDPFKYPLDSSGAHGGGPIRINLLEGASAIGIDHPGAMRITVYTEQGQSVLYQSAPCNKAGGPPGVFCGIVLPVGQTFRRVVIEDWWDGIAELDDIELVVPFGPQPLVQCGTGALAVVLLEFIGGQWVERAPVLTDGAGCASFEGVAPGTVYIGLGVGVMPEEASQETAHPFP